MRGGVFPFAGPLLGEKGVKQFFSKLVAVAGKVLLFAILAICGLFVVAHRLHDIPLLSPLAQWVLNLF